MSQDLRQKIYQTVQRIVAEPGMQQRLLEMGGEIWVVPDINLNHWNSEGRCWAGNYHNYLRRQPGGDLAC
jgi:predicted deacylase